jgi:ElaB/YqjD/DUF883 family membrane-anchored ribosome-binding protein
MEAATKKSHNTRAQHELSDRVQELREQAAVVGEGLTGLASTAGAAATDQLAPVEEYIKENPVRAVLIAAGVGALLGLIFLRR